MQRTKRSRKHSVPKSLRTRLEQLQRRLPRKQPELPPLVAIWEDQCIALIDGEWVPWPRDGRVAPCTKLLLFDPRGI
jgi:hypothetical protein